MQLMVLFEGSSAKVETPLPQYLDGMIKPILERQLALVNTECGAVELRSVPVPDITEEDVLLEVHAVSVCGSDLHQWHGTHGWPVNYPVVLGHEFAGTVVRVGSRVRHYAVGNRVVSETAAYVDPHADLVRMGKYHLDPSRRGFGYGEDGAMARFVRVPERCLHRLPENVDFMCGALTEPCCVAYNAVVNNSEVRPGERVLVLGPGPIGILCGELARLQGAQVAITGLPRDSPRLAVAEGYGILPLTNGVAGWGPVHGVIDATGVSASLRTALEVVRPGGWITKVGWGTQPLACSLDPLVQKEVRLQGSFSHHFGIWEAVLNLLRTGMLDVSPLIGGTWPLKAWRDAFEAMDSGSIIKAVLLPRADQ